MKIPTSLPLFSSHPCISISAGADSSTSDSSASSDSSDSFVASASRKKLNQNHGCDYSSGILDALVTLHLGRGKGFCYKPRILHYHYSLEACFFIIFCCVMDPKHSGDMLKHLEKQNELLMDAYRSMSHELHRLQVEEEMLMRKYYEFMEAQGLIDKNKSSTNPTEDQKTDQAGALVTVTGEEEA
ncbi:hypothetical protein Salat_2457900 [Sesamum alatum]|uniref:Uncharacterized protein n=1 Tax=Sesamum alatum TaxID=300844 RepID=A0AAE1XRJ7_9LAMI|nr:hypothetical protein Salat_2457900 [Sesamum alatum]